MKEQPVLETNRLVLRPLMAQDDLSVRELANDPKIASRSIWLFFPYSEKKALRWTAATLAGQITAGTDALLLSISPL